MNVVDGFAAGSRGVHGITGAFEAAAQEISDAFLVLNHQYSHCFQLIAVGS